MREYRYDIYRPSKSGPPNLLGTICSHRRLERVWLATLEHDRDGNWIYDDVCEVRHHPFAEALDGNFGGLDWESTVWVVLDAWREDGDWMTPESEEVAA